MATIKIDAHVVSQLFNDSVTAGSFTKRTLRNSSISIKK
jgi:hypothetical protein